MLRAAEEADLRRDLGKQRSAVDGRFIAVKDNICTTDAPTTCASRILDRYTSPYDATVVRRLRDAGAVLAGKTNLDEFGMGSHSTNSHSGAVRNVGGELSAGGSSGGSAVAVATSQCHAALGTDTGGSIRLPAAYTGTVGFKPSYGLVSRWGVVAYANSLDTVGVLARDVRSARELFDVINGHDSLDPTSLAPSSRSRIADVLSRRKRGGTLRIGVPMEYNIAELGAPVKHAWLRALQHLESLKHTLHAVSLPSTRHALSAYYVLAPAEASSNLARFDGVRYGTRAGHEDAAPSGPLYAATRAAGLGDEVKRRVLLGAYSLSAAARDNYFLQAQRVRRLVAEDFDRVFGLYHPLRSSSSAGKSEGEGEGDDEGVDVLVSPTAPTLPPTLASLREQSPLAAYTADALTAPASLAGLPAASVPVGIGGATASSAGVQVLGQFGDDALVLDVAALLEGVDG
ncbi:MAG: Trimeric GatFAB AmidoTransferase(AdT) complex subunit [Thelocarpon impressellum]|nr:MAG: Trimeric GatFAB AmidoTransferase(AdT) complex subunit [Thelocarpon impressellum]